MGDRDRPALIGLFISSNYLQHLFRESKHSYFRARPSLRAAVRITVPNRHNTPPRCTNAERECPQEGFDICQREFAEEIGRDASKGREEREAASQLGKEQNETSGGAETA